MAPGSGSLTYGVYPLIELEGAGASGLSNGFTIDGGSAEVVSVGGNTYRLTLQNSGTAESLSIGFPYAPTSFALSASVSNARIMVSGGTTAFSGGILNLGGSSADSLVYTLGLSSLGGSFSPLCNASGTLAAGLSASNAPTTTFTAGTATGPVSLSLSALSATNLILGGNAGGTSPATAIVDVLAQRSVTASSISLGQGGRFMASQSVGGMSTLSTSGNDSSYTRVTVNGTLFNSATSTSIYDLASGTYAPGAVSGSVTLPVTGEGLAGEGSYAGVVVSYSGSLPAEPHRDLHVRQLRLDPSRTIGQPTDHAFHDRAGQPIYPRERQ